MIEVPILSLIITGFSIFSVGVGLGALIILKVIDGGKK